METPPIQSIHSSDTSDREVAAVTLKQAQQALARQAAARQNDQAAAETEHQKEQQAEVAQTRTQMNVQLKFKVDAETNDVTILILDRQSHRVIRTIPSEEILKLKEGDLVELFA
ncbi:MAG: flagellar protein FlaG [Chloroflexi bacterium]|nr:flagellar protein FlaG [Chloroflexota bacterium]